MLLQKGISRLNCLPAKVRGVRLGMQAYNTMLDGLVGRSRDIDDGVVDGALQALHHTHAADPTRSVLRHELPQLHSSTAPGSGTLVRRVLNAGRIFTLDHVFHA